MTWVDGRYKNGWADVFDRPERALTMSSPHSDAMRMEGGFRPGDGPLDPGLIGSPGTVDLTPRPAPSPVKEVPFRCTAIFGLGPPWNRDSELGEVVLLPEWRARDLQHRLNYGETVVDPMDVELAEVMRKAERQVALEDAQRARKRREAPPALPPDAHLPRDSYGRVIQLPPLDPLTATRLRALAPISLVGGRSVQIGEEFLDYDFDSARYRIESGLAELVVEAPEPARAAAEAPAAVEPEPAPAPRKGRRSS